MEEWAKRRGAPGTAAAGQRQPLERDEGPVVRAAAARSGCVEVKYEHMEGDPVPAPGPLRALASDDRTPESCTYEQLEQPLTYALDDIVPGLGPST